MKLLKILFRTIIITIFILSLVQAQFIEHIIVNDFEGAVSLSCAHLDKDSRLDIVATGGDGNHVSWLKNEGDLNFTQHQIISDFGQARVLCTANIDQDDDLDIVATAFSHHKINWFENDGDGNFTSHIITQSIPNPSYVTAGDIDLDGDIDILAISCKVNKIYLFENDGCQYFTMHLIKDNFLGANNAVIKDMDLDGDQDIVASAKFGSIIWFENDGAQNFSEVNICEHWTGASSVQAADLDNDGDIDIAATSCGSQAVAWFENIGGKEFQMHNIIIRYPGARSVMIADMDADGNNDIIAAAWGTFTSSNGVRGTVFYNRGNKNFEAIDFTTDAYDLLKLDIKDLDADGDLDIIGATYGHSEIRWWENINPTVGFGQDNSDIGPFEFKLQQNYPNPFNPTTLIRFTLPQETSVILNIYDCLGKEIKNLNLGAKRAGLHEIEFDAGELPSGIYFYNLQAHNFTQTKKMILMK